MRSFLGAFLSLFFVSVGNTKVQADFSAKKKKTLNVSRLEQMYKSSSLIWYCFRSRSGRSRSGFTDEIR